MNKKGEGESGHGDGGNIIIPKIQMGKAMIICWLLFLNMFGGTHKSYEDCEKFNSISSTI